MASAKQEDEPSSDYFGLGEVILGFAVCALRKLLSSHVPDIRRHLDDNKHILTAYLSDEQKVSLFPLETSPVDVNKLSFEVLALILLKTCGQVTTKLKSHISELKVVIESMSGKTKLRMVDTDFYNHLKRALTFVSEVFKQTDDKTSPALKNGLLLPFSLDNSQVEELVKRLTPNEVEMKALTTLFHLEREMQALTISQVHCNKTECDNNSLEETMGSENDLEIDAAPYQTDDYDRQRTTVERAKIPTEIPEQQECPQKGIECEEISDEEVVKWEPSMPPMLKTGYFDVALLYSEPDLELAETFIDHLKKDIIQDDEPIQAILYNGPDLAAISGSKYESLDFVFERSTFIFVLMTEESCKKKDKWFQLIREEGLEVTLNNPEKTNCVVPVHTQPRSRHGYKTPIGFNRLKGIQYHEYCSGNPSKCGFYVQTLKKLILETRCFRREKERKQMADKIQFITELKAKS